MSYGHGRPPIVQADEAVLRARDLLDHPLSLETDVSSSSGGDRPGIVVANIYCGSQLKLVSTAVRHCPRCRDRLGTPCLTRIIFTGAHDNSIQIP